MSRYKLIDAEKANYPVSVLCKVLKVSRSGYYAWKDRPTSKRDQQNAALAERIREIHHKSRETYGYPRVHAELKALGVRCSRKRVARLMRKDGLRGCIRGRKRKHTTRRDPSAVPVPDLVGRNFAASAPNKLWTADITIVNPNAVQLGTLRSAVEALNRLKLDYETWLPAHPPNPDRPLTKADVTAAAAGKGSN